MQQRFQDFRIPIPNIIKQKNKNIILDSILKIKKNEQIFICRHQDLHLSGQLRKSVTYPTAGTSKPTHVFYDSYHRYSSFLTECQFSSYITHCYSLEYNQTILRSKLKFINAKKSFFFSISCLYLHVCQDIIMDQL